jgi:hypothetical protein
MVFLASCGFQARPPAIDPTIDAPGNDASDNDGTTVAQTCWTISDATNNAHWSACTTAIVPSIVVTGTVSINTDGGDSSPSTYTCAPLADGSANVCALVAGSITIEAGAVLSAHGAKPLALLGHIIDIQGTIDVASHIHGQRGAGALDNNCTPNMTLAKAGGGGAGGTYAASGGNGGDQGGVPNSGGPAGFTQSGSELRGGCDGRRGGDGSSSGGPNGVGGGGGGVVWISSDMNMLKLGDRAVINASGASGAGATDDGHGGHGGGSGGLIVLQSSTITYNANAQIFANGGHGGGGAAGGTPGGDGTDPTGPGSGGGGGAGGQGPSAAAAHGDGGSGYPASTRNGDNGDGPQQGGGGGGGGGQGAIRIASATLIGGGNVSPQPAQWTP